MNIFLLCFGDPCNINFIIKFVIQIRIEHLKKKEVKNLIKVRGGKRIAEMVKKRKVGK